MTPYLTVLMPAYNEESCLARSVDLVRAKLAEMAIAFEVLVVNDASRDRTAAIADGLAASHPDVRACHHPVNQGIGGGFLTGVSEARGQWMILIPADLAMDLNELSRYLDAAASADVVVGVRGGRGDYTRYRLLVSLANVRAIQLLFGLPLRQFNYISMYRLDLLRRVEIHYWRSAFFYAEVLVKLRDLGARLVEVDIPYIARSGGQATGANGRYIAHTAMDMLHFWVTWLPGRIARAAKKAR